MKRLTREEILAFYNAGPEAVVQLVTMLMDTVEILSAEVVQLKERVKTLEDRLVKDSHNSSKPPSSDGFVKPKSQRPKSNQPVGGQKGHPGHTLKMTANPDHVVTHSPSHCRDCNCDLQTITYQNVERRQVFDLPPVRMEITEHHAEEKTCPVCGCINKGVFPATVSQPVQYGPNIKAVTVYLTQYQLLPYERTSELLFDLFGVELSEATLVNINQTCHTILEPMSEVIKQQIIIAPVAHFDESGLYIGGKREWLHVSSTPNATYYEAHPKRGDQATRQIGILPRFQGTAVHDYWKSYLKYLCRHGLCNAHHLRELTAIFELDNQVWPKNMIELLLEIKKTVSQQRTGAYQLEPDQIKTYEACYDQIIQQGFAENPLSFSPCPPRKRGKAKQTKARNLLNRFQHHRRDVLAFMYDFQVPFDNNQAERDIRMIKVKQKVSGTFRSRNGASAFCRIRGYMSTVKKNSLSIMDAMKSIFDGYPLNPFFPSLPPKAE